MKEKMEITCKTVAAGSEAFAEKYAYALKQLKRTNGRALLLFNTREELALFKEASKELSEYTFLFEGDQEISKLVSQFQREEETILCAVHLWEGLDIPGPSLSNVILWSLPYPPNDPVFEAKRKQVADAFWDADMPYMLLRLKQGVGRLIRSHEDEGLITIFMPENTDDKVQAIIEKNLPTAIKVRA